MTGTAVSGLRHGDGWHHGSPVGWSDSGLRPGGGLVRIWFWLGLFVFVPMFVLAHPGLLLLVALAVAAYGVHRLRTRRWFTGLLLTLFGLYMFPWVVFVHPSLLLR